MCWWESTSPDTHVMQEERAHRTAGADAQGWFAQSRGTVCGGLSSMVRMEGQTRWSVWWCRNGGVCVIFLFFKIKIV